MCKHDDIELIAEINDKQSEQILELFACRKCRKTFLFDKKHFSLIAMKDTLLTNLV